MEAIILAGGLGTRLSARLGGLPKPMALIAGRPFLEIVLSRLQSAGCHRVLLSVGFRREVIQNHFGSSFRGTKVEYVIEESPLGTGGAIRKALTLARENPVLVLNGDTFLDVDYSAMLRSHAAEQPPLTIAITPQANIARYGGVLVKDERIVAFEEKGHTGPGWINAGVYLIKRSIKWPPFLPENFSFEADFLAHEIMHLQVKAFPVPNFFLDIGVPEDLDRAQTELKHYADDLDRPHLGQNSAMKEPSFPSTSRRQRTLETVFLDRDGVINKKAPEGKYIHTWNDFELLPCVPEAIASLNRAGVRVLIVSNQRGIALGLYDAQAVLSIHDALQRRLSEFGAHVDGFYFCPHDTHVCNCRKPLRGLYDQAVAEYPGIIAESSVMIGDSLSDVEFGRCVGMRTIFISNGIDTREQENENARKLADTCCGSLADAVTTLFGKVEE